MLEANARAGQIDTALQVAALNAFEELLLNHAIRGQL
jgi:hypothetical protein